MASPFPFILRLSSQILTHGQFLIADIVIFGHYAVAIFGLRQLATTLLVTSGEFPIMVRALMLFMLNTSMEEQMNVRLLFWKGLSLVLFFRQMVMLIMVQL